MNDSARQAQIQSLRNRIPRCVPISDTDFQVKLVNSSFQPLCDLIIHLPNGYPNEIDRTTNQMVKPEIRCNPPVLHDWVDVNTGLVIGHPHLQKGHYVGYVMDLGTLVYEVVTQFSKWPPKLVPQQHLQNQLVGVIQNQNHQTPASSTAQNHTTTSISANTRSVTQTAAASSSSSSSINNSNNGSSLSNNNPNGVQVPKEQLDKWLEGLDEARLKCYLDDKLALQAALLRSDIHTDSHSHGLSDDSNELTSFLNDKRRVCMDLLKNNAKSAGTSLGTVSDSLAENHNLTTEESFFQYTKNLPNINDSSDMCPIERELFSQIQELENNYKLIESRRSDVQILAMKVDSLGAERYRLEILVSKLRTAIQNAEMESERLQESCLNESEEAQGGGNPKEVFMRYKKKILDSRKKVHRLKAKLAKLEVTAKIKN